MRALIPAPYVVRRDLLNRHVFEQWQEMRHVGTDVALRAARQHGTGLGAVVLQPLRHEVTEQHAAVLHGLLPLLGRHPRPVQADAVVQIDLLGTQPRDGLRLLRWFERFLDAMPLPQRIGIPGQQRGHLTRRVHPLRDIAKAPAIRRHTSHSIQPQNICDLNCDLTTRETRDHTGIRRLHQTESDRRKTTGNPNVSNGLLRIRKKVPPEGGTLLVPPVGFEPTTHDLKGRCSNR